MEAYRRYRRAVRRAWLLAGLRAVAGAAGAVSMRLAAERLGWHLPLWAGVLVLCAVAVVTAAWAWRDGKRLPQRGRPW